MGRVHIYLVLLKNKVKSENVNINSSEMLANLNQQTLAVEEAIINSLLRAETMIGRDGNKRHSIPIDDLIAIL